jgi:hypothetical protein
MKYNLKKTFVAIALMGFLTGCSGTIGMGSATEKGPVDAGPSVKELKSSPCACTEIKMNIPAMFAV